MDDDLPAQASMGALLDQSIENADAARAHLADQPDAVGAAVAAAGAAEPGHAVINHEAVCFAVEASNGAMVWMDDRFAAWTGNAFQSDLLRLGPEESVRIELIDRNDGVPVLIAAIARRTAMEWTLPPAALAALQTPKAARLVAVVWAGGSEEALARAGRAFGLTGLEARIAAALVCAGDIRAAAARAKTSYGTARVAVKSALAKKGARRPSVLVSRLARAAAAPVAAGEDAACLRDMFGLTAREARLAAGVSSGLTRAEAARAAGVSDAVAKDLLDRVFRRLRVRSATQLGRLTIEARAMWMLARPSGGQIVVNLSQHEPLQFVPRADDGFIAVSDFGPKSGRPIVLLHQVTMTRYPSRSLVGALQQAGFRPLTIDRPGYGLTDMPRDATDDPFADAAEDMARVADALHLGKIDLLARTAAHVALAFARQHPERVGRVVLLSPDPMIAASSRRSGPLGFLKDIIHRHPDWIESLARFLASQATPERVAANLRRALRASPADLAAMRDPANLEDYQRGVLLFATGQLEGMVREQRAFALSSMPDALPCAHDWRVLIGVQDAISAADDMDAYWRRLLPGAAFARVADGGRFLHLSHLPRVIEALGQDR